MDDGKLKLKKKSKILLLSLPLRPVPVVGRGEAGTWQALESLHRVLCQPQEQSPYARFGKTKK